MHKAMYTVHCGDPTSGDQHEQDQIGVTQDPSFTLKDIQARSNVLLLYEPYLSLFMLALCVKLRSIHCNKGTCHGPLAYPSAREGALWISISSLGQRGAKLLVPSLVPGGQQFASGLGLGNGI